MSTLKTTNLQHASAASPAIVLAADGSATAQLSSINGGPLAGSRNRIINGDMRIDQRNAGAAITPTAAVGYTLDRFNGVNTIASKLTYQQVSDAPTGFNNSLKITVASAATPSAGDQFRLCQPVEGYNIADFGWGAAGALAVTVSFKAKASIAGTYSVALWNGANGRSYVTTVSLTTSWASYSFTVPGDTTGTWATNNTLGLEVIFDLGGGSNWVTSTTNAWQAANYFRASGSVSLVGNAGATLNITGVQLEPGTVATPFERIDYSESLRRCQRYYQVLGPSDTLTTGTTICVMPQADTGAVNENWGMTEFKVSMRAAPTVSASSWELAGHHGNTPIITAGTKYALFRYDGSNFRGSGGRLLANNAQASAEL